MANENGPVILSLLLFSVSETERVSLLNYLARQKDLKKEIEILEKLNRKKLLNPTDFIQAIRRELSYHAIRTLVGKVLSCLREVSTRPEIAGFKLYADAVCYNHAGIHARSLVCIQAGIKVAQSVESFGLVEELAQLGKRICYENQFHRVEPGLLDQLINISKANWESLCQYKKLLHIADAYYFPMVQAKRNAGVIDYETARLGLKELSGLEGKLCSVKSEFWYLILSSYFQTAVGELPVERSKSTAILDLFERNRWLISEKPDLISKELFTQCMLACENLDQQTAVRNRKLLKHISMELVSDRDKHNCRQFIAECVYVQSFGNEAMLIRLIENWTFAEKNIRVADVSEMVERIYFSILSLCHQYKNRLLMDEWLRKLIYFGRNSLNQQFQIAGRLQYLIGLYEWEDLSQLAISAENYLKYCARHPEIFHFAFFKSAFVMFKQLANSVTKAEKREVLLQFKQQFTLNAHQSSSVLKLVELEDWIGGQLINS